MIGYIQETTVASVLYFGQKEIIQIHVYPFLPDAKNSELREVQYCSFTDIHIFVSLAYKRNISKNVIWPTDTYRNWLQQPTHPAYPAEPVTLAPGATVTFFQCLVW